MLFSSVHRIEVSNQVSVYLQGYAPFENELYLDRLTNPELERFEAIHNPRKQNEFVATRILKEHLFPHSEIVYNEIGAPRLSNNDSIHISISHTVGMVGIAQASFQLGFDLEPIRGLAKKIQAKFIHPKEQLIVDINNELEMTKAWSAKESLYKVANRKEIIFATEMEIVEKINEANWRCNILKKEGWFQYLIHFKESEGNVLAVTIDTGQPIF